MLESDPCPQAGGAHIPTAFFRDPQLNVKLEGDDKENLNVLGYKSLHYDHMRQFIQEQELAGNQIKFSLLDSKYAVCFDSKPQQGKAHFYVYEIFKRQIIRRFDPLNKQMSLKFDNSPARVAHDKSNRNQEDLEFGNRKKSQSSATSTSSRDAQEENEESTDFEEDVSVFEVSPLGSFLVAVVGNEFLSLKHLPRGSLKQLKSTLTPCYIADYNEDFPVAQKNGPAPDQQVDSVVTPIAANQ